MSRTSARPLVVGLSISTPPDVRDHGVGLEHVDDALAEIVKHLLVSGRRLVYGGDLRVGGYTELVIELVRRYQPEAEGSFHDLLPWPAHLDLTRDAEAELAPEVRVERVPGPGGRGVDRHDPYLRAVALGTMRERLVGQIDALVAIGGKTGDVAGPVPGLVDEVGRALTAGRPVYLMGGFGGATALIREVIAGGSPPQLTPGHQRRFARYRRVEAAFAARGRPIDWDAALAPLRTGPRPDDGLTDVERDRLGTSVDVDELVALLERGLDALDPPATD